MTSAAAESGEKSVRDFLFRLMPAFFEDRRIEAVWVEGEPVGSRPRLSMPVDLHVAAPEPVFEEVVRSVPEILSRTIRASVSEPRPADFEGRSFSVQTEDGLAVSLTIERTALVGKRPRRAILPQMDRSGLLRYAVDLSLAKPKA